MQKDVTYWESFTDTDKPSTWQHSVLKGDSPYKTKFSPGLCLIFVCEASPLGIKSEPI